MTIIAKNLREAISYLNESRESRFYKKGNQIIEVEADGSKISWSYEKTTNASGNTMYKFYC